MKIQDIMDKYPITVNEDTNVKAIAELLTKHRITSVPVVDEDFNLLGLVSEGDILYKKVRPNAPHYVNLLGASIFYGGLSEYNADFKKLLAVSAKDLMTKNVIVCHADEDVEEVATVMLEQHLKVVPVTKDNKVVGVVSRHDIIALIAEGE